jgi:hypothetical protein
MASTAKPRQMVLIGPFPPPLTGNAVANQMVLSGLARYNIKPHLINTSEPDTIQDTKKQGAFRVGTFLKSMKDFFFFVHLLCTQPFEAVYFTPGQSFLGFMRYLPYISLSRLFNIPTVAHFHGGLLKSRWDRFPRIQRVLYLSILSRIDGLIFLSKRLVINDPRLLETWRCPKRRYISKVGKCTCSF